VGVEKSAPCRGFWGLRMGGEERCQRSYALAGVGDSVGRLRNRTSRLMFWAVAARKNCSRTNFNRRNREPLEADVAATLQFREERFYLFPLTLRVSELLCRPEMNPDLSAKGMFHGTHK